MKDDDLIMTKSEFKQTALEVFGCSSSKIDEFCENHSVKFYLLEDLIKLYEIIKEDLKCKNTI